MTTPTNGGVRILVSTGDVSGDVAGAFLTREILAQRPDAVVLGIGGPHMAGAGAVLRVRTSHLGATGVTEVIDMLPAIVRFWRTILAVVRSDRPDAAILIGNDLFHGLLGRALRRRGVPTVSYFPPPPWMWGPLLPLFRKSFDVVLASFPGEQEAYERVSKRARVEFVGHYLTDALNARTETTVHEARARLGIAAGRRVVSLMPGSRNNEVSQLLPAMADAARLMLARDPDIHFLLPIADEVFREAIARHLTQAGVSGLVTAFADPRHDAMTAADMVILASGTASLEATLLGVPMVILYKLSAVTAAVARSAIRVGIIGKEVVGLPNLILGRTSVQELTQEHVNGVEIATAAFALLDSPERRLAAVADLAEAAQRLAGGGGLAHAASILLEVARHPPRQFTFG